MILAFLLACPGRGEVHLTTERHYQEPYRAEGADVIVVVLDTLRADHLSQYGYALNTSPGLAEFASVATRYTRAFAPSPWTVPSTGTILTGQHPLRHGLRHPGDVLPDEIDTLPEMVRRAGWQTAAYSYNVSVSPRHALDQGFDSFTRNTGRVLAYPHARRMTKAASAWLAEHADKPSFLYVQPMNCHGPYKVPDPRRATLLQRQPSTRFKYYGGLMKSIVRDGEVEARARVGGEYLQSLQEQYDTAIRYTTDEIGVLFDELRSRGRFDSAMIVLTADHGEELFEHGGFSHGYSLHAEVLHVPLFVKFPGQGAPQVVTQPVSLLDVTPTVLTALGLPVPPLDGEALVPAAAPTSNRALLFDINWPRRIVGRGLLHDGYKLLSIEHDYAGRKHALQLYDTDLDPGESRDLATAMPELVSAMSGSLDAMATALTGSVVPQNVLSEMDRRQLEALGYME